MPQLLHHSQGVSEPLGWWLTQCCIRRCVVLALTYALLFISFTATIALNSGFAGESSLLWGLRLVENLLLLLLADDALLSPLLFPPAPAGAILAYSARVGARLA
ncbi:hypothetical protein T484DRAFT_1803877 [Baffinella frigidus]|nr:hypothetical protein T484DRAFT_1803877 [Cryptophyta sp. CCMP2293]